MDRDTGERKNRCRVDGLRTFRKSRANVSELPPETVSEVGTEKIGTLELMDLSMRTRWEDLKLFGTAFQLKVWRQLYLLTHKSDGTPRLPEDGVKLLSYSQLAKLCDNPSGVRAVAPCSGSQPYFRNHPLPFNHPEGVHRQGSRHPHPRPIDHIQGRGSLLPRLHRCRGICLGKRPQTPPHRPATLPPHAMNFREK